MHKSMKSSIVTAIDVFLNKRKLEIIVKGHGIFTRKINTLILFLTQEIH